MVSGLIRYVVGFNDNKPFSTFVENFSRAISYSKTVNFKDHLNNLSLTDLAFLTIQETHDPCEW